jgi:predicted NACHT family NTPase
VLTRSFSEKNEQFLQELWARADVLSKNIVRLRIDLANQAPGALRLQLEHDIERAEEDRDKVLRELEYLEQAIKNQAELQAEHQEEYRRKYLDTFIRNLIEDPDLKVPYIEPYFATRPKNRVMQKLPDEQSLSDDSLEEDTGEGDLAFNEVLRDVLYDREQRNWVITGEAGMGKTTLLKKIGLQYAREAQLDKTRPLPVFILLAEFAQDFQQQTQMKETLSSLSAHIAAKLRDSFRGITAREVEDNIKEDITSSWMPSMK